jgi:hypothetical protein
MMGANPRRRLMLLFGRFTSKELLRKLAIAIPIEEITA